LTQPFIPESLPPAGLAWEGLIPLLGKANRSLARYGGILEALPNPAILLSPVTTREAVLSSKIEGTQATLGDVLKFEAGERPAQSARAADIHEILNYRAALLAAEKELRTRSLSLSVMKGLHGILLKGVRGQEHELGGFRTVQNWIGLPGSPIEKAAFIPPSPIGLAEHLEAWERYYRSEQPDALVQLAIVHAQFEIIHPFTDGNGRLGRILIPLFLYEKKLLSRPMFYLSAWFESRRSEYIAKLRAIGRDKAAWNEWILFFLRGIDEQADENGKTARSVLALHERLKARVLDLTNSQYALPVLDQAFKRPVFHSAHLRFGPKRPSRPAVANLLRALREGGVLKVVREGAGRRPTVYVLAELVNLCEGERVF
jgi:Fic family protein